MIKLNPENEEIQKCLLIQVNHALNYVGFGCFDPDNAAPYIGRQALSVDYDKMTQIIKYQFRKDEIITDLKLNYKAITDMAIHVTDTTTWFSYRVVNVHSGQIEEKSYGSWGIDMVSFDNLVSDLSELFDSSIPEAFNRNKK